MLVFPLGRVVPSASRAWQNSSRGSTLGPDLASSNFCIPVHSTLLLSGLLCIVTVMHTFQAQGSPARECRYSRLICQSPHASRPARSHRCSLSPNLFSTCDEVYKIHCVLAGHSPIKPIPAQLAHLHWSSGHDFRLSRVKSRQARETRVRFPDGELLFALVLSPISCRCFLRC